MHFSKVVRFAAVAALTVVSAFASSMTVQGIDPDRGRSINFKYNSGSGLRDHRVYAGVIEALVDSHNLELVCVDLFHYIRTNVAYDVTLEDESTVNNGSRVAWMIVNLWDSITTPDWGAGFQLAVWDLVHDNGDGLLAGNVRKSRHTASNVVTAANFYLGQSLNFTPTDGIVYTNRQNPHGIQKLFGADPNPPSVPEPATFALMGAGLLGLVVFRRRRSA